MTTPEHAPTRQPIFNIPGTILGFLALLVAVQLWRDWRLTDVQDLKFVYDYGFIPARWSVAFLSDGVSAVMNALPEGSNSGLSYERFLAERIVQDQQAGLWTAFTHALLHGSWTHLAFNSVWLVAFGSPLVRRWGGLRFTGFCALTALTGAIAYYAVLPYSAVPVIGASGIVSGMFGAAAWYAFGRGANGFMDNVGTQQRSTLAEMLRNRTVVTFVIFWFVGNFATAAMPGLFSGEEVSIAWQAHIGGFIGGFLLFPLIDDRIPKA